MNILEEAHEVIYGDREQTYGDPGKNLRVIANYWTTYWQSRGVYVPFDFDDVANMMVLLKMARLGNSPRHRDSMVDACGYLALVERVIGNAQQEEQKPADSSSVLNYSLSHTNTSAPSWQQRPEDPKRDLRPSPVSLRDNP